MDGNPLMALPPGVRAKAMRYVADIESRIQTLSAQIDQHERTNAVWDAKYDSLEAKYVTLQRNFMHLVDYIDLMESPSPTKYWERYLEVRSKYAQTRREIPYGTFVPPVLPYQTRSGTFECCKHCAEDAEHGHGETGRDYHSVPCQLCQTEEGITDTRRAKERIENGVAEIDVAKASDA